MSEHELPAIKEANDKIESLSTAVTSDYINGQMG
jgi:hypothetical protein